MDISAVVDTNSLQRALNDFPKLLIDNVSEAMQISGRDMQIRAQDNHEFTSKNGHLEASVKVQHDKKKLETVIGLDLGVASYADYIHEGTEPHIISIKNKKYLRWFKGGKAVFAKKVNHPGTKPDPFVTNAGKLEQKNFSKRIFKAVEKSASGAFL